MSSSPARLRRVTGLAMRIRGPMDVVLKPD